MSRMKTIFTSVLTWMFVGAASVAMAQDVQLPKVDLLLQPGLPTADAPFYRGAKVKIDEQIVPVQEGELPQGQLAEYQADKNVVVVSNATNVSEIAKGQALLDVVTALQVGGVATAAGQ